MIFGATDYEGNIVVDFGKPLHVGIPYLQPRITVSNNFYGTVQFDVLFDYTNKPSERMNCEVSINGAGDYYLPGWGNSEGTAYGESQSVKVRIVYKGSTLYTAIAKIGGGGRIPEERKRYPTSDGSESGWARFNYKISRIGDWFEDNTDTVSAVIMGLIGLVYIISVIATWVNDGFWVALIAGIIGLFIAGIAWFAISIITNIAMWVLKLIFSNGWTFIIALVIIVATQILPAMALIFDGDDDEKYSYVEQEYVESTTPYVCTARSLNVRKEPTGNAAVVGTLRKGDRIDVYNISNGFAHIRYFNQDAYVSAQYIEIDD